jgi:hypothetical protein
MASKLDYRTRGDVLGKVSVGHEHYYPLRGSRTTTRAVVDAVCSSRKGEDSRWSRRDTRICGAARGGLA